MTDHAWSYAQADETSRAAYDSEIDSRIGDANRRYDALRRAPDTHQAVESPRADLHREQLLDDLMGDVDDPRFSAPLAPACTQPALFQPFVGATTLKDGEPFWGAYHCDGIFLSDAELCRRAQRNSIERDHLEAMRRNDWLDRQRVRYEITPLGRAAIAESPATHAA